MKRLAEYLVTLALGAAAVAVAAAAVHREFFAPRVVVANDLRGPPVLIKEWEQVVATGELIGDSAAPVRIAEFADLECPFCRTFHSRFVNLRKEFGNKVALIYVHFPLPNHRFARPAARALECARLEGRFEQFHDVVYEKQDSLGLRSWLRYATDAGVRDTSRFNRCIMDTSRVARVEEGLALGAKLGVHGTPTILVNGWRYPLPPDETVLTKAVRTLLARR